MPANLRTVLTREAALFLGLLCAGLVLLPIAVYLVGDAIFGDYAGHGYGDFFGSLSARVRGFDGSAWFLILSPWLAVSVLRLMAWGWRSAGRRSA